MNDPLEQEAEAVADRVMRMPEPTVGLIQRCPGGCPDEEALRRQPADDEEEEELIQRCPGGCPDEEVLRRQPADEDEEELIQRQPADVLYKAPVDTPHAALEPEIEGAIRARRGGGSSLPGSTRRFFEPRFAANLGGVRIHHDSTAASLARSVNARAFTVGREIFFGAGEWAPGTRRSDRLIAHELTHTIQQQTRGMPGPAEPAQAGRPGQLEAANWLRRTVGANSTCSANVHGAPANPLATLRSLDQMAQDMALGASNVLMVEAVDFDNPTFGPTEVSRAYRTWFGTPVRTTAGLWRSRFRTTPFPTRAEAIEHEMTVFSDRFRRIHGWLARDIRYRCPGTASFTIPGCVPDRCEPSDAAATCPTGSRTIGICPPFWVEPAPQDRAQAADLIHEAIHPLFHFERHATGTPLGRGRNPGCYQGFVLEIFNTGLVPGDCTPI